MNFIKTIALMFMFSSGFFSLHSMGLGDWSCETGNGTTIHNPSGGVYMWYRKGEVRHSLDNLNKWYFYKKNVIGKYYKFNHDTRKWERGQYYFVLDENEGTLDTFSNELTWNIFLREKLLVPPNKTKWHNNSWKPIDQILLLWFLCSIPVGMFFGIPYLIIGLIVSLFKGKRAFLIFLELTGLILGVFLILFLIIAIPALIMGYFCFSY